MQASYCKLFSVESGVLIYKVLYYVDNEAFHQGLNLPFCDSYICIVFEGRQASRILGIMKQLISKVCHISCRHVWQRQTFQSQSLVRSHHSEPAEFV